MSGGWTLRTILAGAAVVLALDGLRRETGLLALMELGLAGLIAAFLVFGRPPVDDDGHDEVRGAQPGAQPVAVWRPPVIPGASRSLLQVLTPIELDDLRDVLSFSGVSARLQLLANNLRHGAAAGGRGRTVLLDNATPTDAGAVAATIARTAIVPLIRLRADHLVSAEAGFAQRALNVLLHYLVAHRPAVVLVQHLDRIAQPDVTFPTPQARRATNDLVAALGRSAALPGVLVIVATESANTLDSSVTRAHFDFVIRRAVTRRAPPRLRCRRHPQAA